MTRILLVVAALAVCGFTACGAMDNIATASELRAEWGAPCSVDDNHGLEVWHYCAAPCPGSADGEWCHTACSEGCSPMWSITVSNGVIIHTDGPEGGR